MFTGVIIMLLELREPHEEFKSDADTPVIAISSGVADVTIIDDVL
jgi:hypothetical protein